MEPGEGEMSGLVVVRQVVKARNGVHHLRHALLILLVQPFVSALHAGDDLDGLGQHVMAFLQLLQTFFEGHNVTSYMIPTASLREVFCTHG